MYASVPTKIWRTLGPVVIHFAIYFVVIYLAALIFAKSGSPLSLDAYMGNHFALITIIALLISFVVNFLYFRRDYVKQSDYLKKTYGSMYDEQAIKEMDSMPDSGLVDASFCKDEELFDLAVEVILENGTASVSVLQQKLAIGYPAAARLIDELEKKRIIGPFEGSKPRRVIITREEWDKRKGNS